MVIACHQFEESVQRFHEESQGTHGEGEVQERLKDHENLAVVLAEGVLNEVWVVVNLELVGRLCEFEGTGQLEEARYGQRDGAK